jgi:hypothetical protein
VDIEKEEMQLARHKHEEQVSGGRFPHLPSPKTYWQAADVRQEKWYTQFVSETKTGSPMVSWQKK